MQKNATVEDFIGVKFGSLTVIKKCEEKSDRIYYVCACDCGKIVRVPLGSMQRGRHKSCGCRIQLMYNGDPKMTSAKKVWFDYKKEDLKFEDFYKLSQMRCFYCNSYPNNKVNIFTYAKRKENHKFSGSEFDFVYNGLDRIDSSNGHELDNVVPCCSKCNSFKMDMGADDFKIHLKRAAANHLYGVDSETMDKIVREWLEKTCA